MGKDGALGSEARPKPKGEMAGVVRLRIVQPVREATGGRLLRRAVWVDFYGKVGVRDERTGGLGSADSRSG